MKQLLLTVLLFLCAASSHAQNVTYSNPVLRGDFPDPSVIRVGEDYWATATSSEWGPLYPILHSRDLVNWQVKGHIFKTKPEWSSRNYWAPELYHHKGKFYVYYVGRKNEEKGALHVAVATADHPLGPWTDHGSLIGQDEGSIDGIIETDEKGDRYMLWKNDGNSRREPTYIYAQKLSEDGLKLVGEMKQLIRNDQPWEGALIEGPDVLKHGEYFYLFYAGSGCCGRKCDYGTGVARSKSLLGPYEKYSKNPVIAHNDKWRCPGHGTLVSTPDGRDFFLYHAYDAEDFHYVGRQGVLDEVKWTDDGWPVINQGKGTSVQAASPFGKPQIAMAPEFSDDFVSTNLNLRWQWPHMIDPQYTIAGGKLKLRSAAGRGNDLFGSVLAVQTVTGDYAATTLVENGKLKSGAQAGLFAFGDPQNALGITVDAGTATVIRRQKDKTETVGSMKLPAMEKTYLRLEARQGHLFKFYVWNGGDWVPVGSDTNLNGDYLPPWDRGIRVAITAGGNESAAATFEWLRVVQQPESAQQ